LNPSSHSLLRPLFQDLPESVEFAPLPANLREPSELDENPRYLRLVEFRSRWLPSKRDVIVYLPEVYLTEPERRFPVFYLHDGQNVFDGRTSYIPDHTWCATTTADELVAENKMEPMILVGVANTGKQRLNEYTPTRDVKLGGGVGDRYGKLLVEELKPLIDRTFRTLEGPENTALGGSSLGGLISLALGLEYPQVFGKLAVMSPSVWWNQRSILNLVKKFKPGAGVVRPKIWLDMGTAEGLRHLRDTDLLHRRLQIQGWKGAGTALEPNLRYLRVEGGLHTEDSWAARFDETLEFLFPVKESAE
jgi:predicted alpha/beta superfamily hydrolase